MSGRHERCGLAALEERLRGLPPAWQSHSQPTSERLACSHRPRDCGGAAAEPLADDARNQSSGIEIRLAPAAGTTAAASVASSLRARHRSIGVSEDRGRDYADGKILKGYTQDFTRRGRRFAVAINHRHTRRSAW